MSNKEVETAEVFDEVVDSQIGEDVNSEIGETTNNTEESPVYESVVLENVNVYSSPLKTRRSSTASGDYVVNSNPVDSENGRIKIYDPNNLDEVIGWVNFKDIVVTEVPDDFASVIEGTLVVESKEEEKEVSTSSTFNEGDVVRLKPHISTYSNFSRTRIPDSIRSSAIYIRSKVSPSGEVFVSPSKTGAVTGVVHVTHLIKVNE